MDHPRFLYDLEHCSIRRALDVLGEKWTMLVLREAFYGLSRFDDFARALGCGRGVLSARLKTLTEAGILERREYKEPDRRARTEYRLTDKGRDLFPAILALSQWSERWTPPPEGPVARVLEPQVRASRHRRHDRRSDAVEALGMRDVEIMPGPGAKRLDPSAAAIDNRSAFEGKPAMPRPVDIWLAAGVRTPFAKVDGPLARLRRHRALGAGGAAHGRPAEGRQARLRGVGRRRAQPHLQQHRPRGADGCRHRRRRCPPSRP